MDGWMDVPKSTQPRFDSIHRDYFFGKLQFPKKLGL